MSAQFDDRPDVVEAGLARGLDQRAGKAIVVDMNGLPATVADQEDAIVAAAGMAVGDIGVGAFDSAGKVGADEQVEDPIDAVRGHALAPLGRDAFSDVVSGSRAVAFGQCGEDIGAHLGPLLARLDERVAGGIDKAVAAMFVMVMA